VAVIAFGEQFPIGVCLLSGRSLACYAFAMSCERKILWRDEVESNLDSVCSLALYHLCYGHFVLLLFMWVI